jgi:hypothetical protein
MTLVQLYSAHTEMCARRNARIAGMTKDLDLTGDRYDWLLTIFYISYILVSEAVSLYLGSEYSHQRDSSSSKL